MEASVAVKAAPADPPESHDGSEASRSSEELFQWSGYVHVGRGAEECEHGVDGGCRDREHFHAWVCLPNTYQIRDVADKARAARARKVRALKDPESDSYAILEAELDELREPEAFKALIELVADREIEHNLLPMIEELQKDERFEHHAQDSEEYNRLRETPEDERDTEEWERLQQDMLDYSDKLREEIDKRKATEIAHLEAKSVDDVIAMERKSRIDNISNEQYLHVYYTWAIYVGAREPTTEGFPTERKFKTPEAQRTAAPEVIAALREKISELEQRTTSRGDAAGN